MAQTFFPAAVELAKLALWLTAARQNEPSADLTRNFVIGDSLSAAIRSRLPHVGTFDVVVGNPPWGGVYDGINAAAVLAEAAYLHLTLNGIRGRYLSSYVGSH